MGRGELLGRGSGLGDLRAADGGEGGRAGTLRRAGLWFPLIWQAWPGGFWGGWTEIGPGCACLGVTCRACCCGIAQDAGATETTVVRADAALTALVSVHRAQPPFPPSPLNPYATPLGQLVSDERKGWWGGPQLLASCGRATFPPGPVVGRGSQRPIAWKWSPELRQETKRCAQYWCPSGPGHSCVHVLGRPPPSLFAHRPSPVA